MISTSLQISEALREWGMSQVLESGSYAFCTCCEKRHLIHEDNDEGGLVGSDYSHKVGENIRKHFIRSYTIHDLIEILPAVLDTPIVGIKLVLVIGHPMDWQVSYRNKEKQMIQTDEELVDALAKMVIYLRGEGILTL